MTCCPTYLWISPCEKPPRYLVKPIYATSSLKWKIPFKKNSVTVHRPYFMDLHRTKGLQWQKVHVCGSFLSRILHSKQPHFMEVSWDGEQPNKSQMAGQEGEKEEQRERSEQYLLCAGQSSAWLPPALTILEGKKIWALNPQKGKIQVLQFKLLKTKNPVYIGGPLQ